MEQSQQELKEQIENLVREYYERFHQKKFIPKVTVSLIREGSMTLKKW